MKAKAKETSARIGLAALAGAGMTFAFPALAFAAEEESSGGLSAILPDMAEFIPMLVIFILLWIVLAKFGWPKFEAMLEKREMTIKDSLEKSEQARVESERVLEEYKRQLEDAKAQAAQIVADAKKTGEAVKADITDKAQSEATAMIEKAHNAIEAEKKAAISELQGSVADLDLDDLAFLFRQVRIYFPHRCNIPSDWLSGQSPITGVALSIRQRANFLYNCMQ